MENHAENVHQKLGPDSFLTLLNNAKQPLYTGILLKIRFSERGLSASLKKVKFIFSFRPSSF